jgi:glycosyltransferase involved in cell wall biosynthesis
MSDEARQPAGAAPRVTVGLAVYNGEAFLREAIDSILAQSYGDFELVISDNDSSDSTAEICAGYAARDPRVRYFRNPYNIGGVRNENRTLFLARGTYFKLAAHDDKLAPRFLERCVAVLDSDPAVEVVMTAVRSIDGQGKLIELRAARAGTERSAPQRIRSIASWGYGCEASYGLMRMSALTEVRPQTNRVHSDRVVLCELALRRPFHLVEEPLFYKRNHEGNVFKDWRARMAWYQPELKRTGGIRLPHWLHVFDYLAMLGRSRVGALDRVRCSVELLRCFWRMKGNLVMDIVDAARMLWMGRLGRRRRYQDESSWR